MTANIYLQTLLSNPILNGYKHIPVPSTLIQNTFGSQICLPQLKFGYPFTFSCFALSLDGKLCYPDTQSGYDIAKANHRATEDERYADWLYLMIARSISDGIILTKSTAHKLLSNHSEYSLVHLKELQHDRLTNNKPANPTGIIFCRDLSKFDLNHVITYDNSIIILTLDTQDNMQQPKNSCWHNISLTKWEQSPTAVSFESPNRTIIYCKNNTAGSDLLNLLAHNLGINIILNESPYWHHKLLEQKALHEIWLNYATSYVGGDGEYLGKQQLSFTSTNHPDTAILALYNLGYNFLYSRQIVKYN